MSINLEWLRTFKLIYELGTLSAAAKALYTSQPGVSLHLNSLEAFTGSKLFERTSRRMIPTEKGEILYNYIQEPLHKLTLVADQFQANSIPVRHTLSIGMCFETFQYTLEAQLSKLPFNLIIRFGEYKQMQADLAKGILDLIVTPKKGIDQQLSYSAFATERIILVADKHYDPSAFKEAADRRDKKEMIHLLKQGIWYSTAADTDNMRNFWLQHFDEHPDFSPNFIVPNISSTIRCLANGVGFAVVPDFLCKEALQQKEIQFLWEGFDPIENTLYFGTKAKPKYPEAIKTIKQLFLTYWQ